MFQYPYFGRPTLITSKNEIIKKYENYCWKRMVLWFITHFDV
jgi:hypothetical protein